MVFISLFIHFDGFGDSWRNLESQVGRQRWLPLKNDDLVRMSCDVISPFYGRQRKQFSTYYLPIAFFNSGKSRSNAQSAKRKPFDNKEHDSTK